MKVRLLATVALTLAFLAGAGATVAPAQAVDAPGTVSSTGLLPREWWVPGTAQAFETTYWTSGPGDRPALSSGAVYLPAGTPPPGGWPVVSWAHGTVGLGDQCAPTKNAPTVRDSAYLAHWMQQGYAIVATDYVGLGTPGVHPYLDGPVAAHSVIDMVRAARTKVPQLSSKWVVIGQSQGGQAAMFTGRIARAYAPELDFRGTVGTGVPSNLENLLSAAGPYVPPLPVQGTNVYTAMLLAGLRAARPDLHLNDYLTPHGVAVLDRIEGLCYDEAARLVDGDSIGSLLARPLSDPPVAAAIHAMLEVPTSGYDRPVFIGQGLNDRTVPAPLTAKLVVDLLIGGTDLTPRVYPRGHSETMVDSLPDSTPFVHRLFEG